MEIRERMAKMSGGMGMAGMFGPPGGTAPMPPRRQVPSSSERKSSGNERAATGESFNARAPPVPMMPMPGLSKVRSPEQDDSSSIQVSKEEANDVPTSITQGRSPTDMPDVEDLKEESMIPSRRSTDRQIPPPLPYGKLRSSVSACFSYLQIHRETWPTTTSQQSQRSTSASTD